MRRLALCLMVLIAACQRDTPPTPTSAETEQLNDAESMLNDLANEEGPEAGAPDPSNFVQ